MFIYRRVSPNKYICFSLPAVAMSQCPNERQLIIVCVQLAGLGICGFLTLAPDARTCPPLSRHDLMASLAKELAKEPRLHSWRARVRVEDSNGYLRLRSSDLQSLRALDISQDPPPRKCRCCSLSLLSEPCAHVCKTSVPSSLCHSVSFKACAAHHSSFSIT